MSSPGDGLTAGQPGAATRDTVTGPSSAPCPASTASASAAEQGEDDAAAGASGRAQRVGVGVDRVGRQDCAATSERRTARSGVDPGRHARGEEVDGCRVGRDDVQGDPAGGQAVSGATGHEPRCRERLAGGDGTHRPDGRRHPRSAVSAPGWARRAAPWRRAGRR